MDIFCKKETNNKREFIDVKTKIERFDGSWREHIFLLL
jgi:hypothetical protein